MNDENTISINISDLTQILSELEAVTVKFDDEILQQELNLINTNLEEISLLLSSQEVQEVQEFQEVESSEVLEDEPDLYLETLQSINDNLLNLNETVLNQRTDELADLQVKAYGSNIIILFLLIVFGLFKGVSKIFGLVNKAI